MNITQFFFEVLESVFPERCEFNLYKLYIPKIFILEFRCKNFFQRKLTLEAEDIPDMVISTITKKRHASFSLLQ
jgi:hypothetical protein